VAVLALAGGLPAAASAQQRCVRSAWGSCVDLRVTSAAVGYGAARVGALSSGSPDRVLQGLDMRFDVHILSLLLRRLRVATYDALYVDATFGKMTSRPLSLGGVEEANGFDVAYSYGYQFLAGVRGAGVALLGGVGYLNWGHDIGGTMMKNTATPVVARLEVGRAKPVVLMGWYAGSDRMAGARIDVPFFRRLDLTAVFWRAKGTTELITTPNGMLEAATATTLVVGFRTAEIR
jgi:hypothetical protein